MLKRGRVSKCTDEQYCELFEEYKNVIVVERDGKKKILSKSFFIFTVCKGIFKYMYLIILNLQKVILKF